MNILTSFTGDNQFVGDVKALENGRDMYLAHKVQAASILIKDGHVFFTGMVDARYKHKVFLSAKRCVDVY